MSIFLNAIELPSDLLWVDEYDWSPVEQTINKSLTGALIIQEAAQLKGRPITLVGGNDYAWVTKATLESLRLLTQTAAENLTLNYHGTDYNVRFMRDSSPVQGRQVADFANPQSDDRYSVTIRLIEV